MGSVQAKAAATSQQQLAWEATYYRNGLNKISAFCPDKSFHMHMYTKGLMWWSMQAKAATISQQSWFGRQAFGADGHVHVHAAKQRLWPSRHPSVSEGSVKNIVNTGNPFLRVGESDRESEQLIPSELIKLQICKHEPQCLVVPAPVHLVARASRLDACGHSKAGTQLDRQRFSNQASSRT